MKQLFFFFFVSLSIFTCYPEGTIHIIINVKSANYRKPQKKKKDGGQYHPSRPGWLLRPREKEMKWSAKTGKTRHRFWPTRSFSVARH